MKIAYLMNTYPMTSTTFVRREIQALEKLGLDITRYAVRTWAEALVEPADVEEKKRTHYLLSNNLGGLLSAFGKTLVNNPKGFINALSLWWTLISNAKGMLVQNTAYLLQATYLSMKAKADQIDHIHVHFSTNAATVAMLARRMGGPSFSFTAHGPDEFDAPVHASMAEKVNEAAFVVAISDFCKSQLIRFSSFNNWDKVKVFRCGIAIDDFRYSSANFADNFQLVCVGRLSDLKGQLMLPEVAARLKDTFPNLRIVLIGDGPSRPQLQEKIRQLGVEKLIELKGWQNNEQVRQIVSQSRALLLPSFAEGLPIVFMEALALGRPVVATYIAGIPELVDEGVGWIVPAGSTEALEEAIRSVLQCPVAELEAMGAAGRARVEAMHDINGLAQNLKLAFESVLNSRTGRAQ